MDMLSDSTLYSIGHGHKTVDELIAELLSYNIHYLVDVRTNPFSKWAPQFNQGIIENELAHAGIKYVYMGDTIGGKPQSSYCYDDEGFFDYEKMAEAPTFKQGLHRLLVANEKRIPLAVMCTESDPSQCHRSKLIGRELYFTHDLMMSHIIENGKTISQSDIMTELTKGLWTPQGDIFGPCEPPYFKSRKAYKESTSEVYAYD